MRRLMQDVGSYTSHFMIFYLISCILLGPLFMILGLVVMTVLHFGFGVDVGGDEDNLLGGIGIGISLAFVVSWPLALVGTIWAAPNDRNVNRDHKTLVRRMGDHLGATQR